MNVTEKELLKSGAADSSSLVKHRKAIIALLVIAAVLIATLAGARLAPPLTEAAQRTRIHTTWMSKS